MGYVAYDELFFFRGVYWSPGGESSPRVLVLRYVVYCTIMGIWEFCSQGARRDADPAALIVPRGLLGW